MWTTFAPMTTDRLPLVAAWIVPRLPLACIVAEVLLVPLSWVGSVYDWGTNSLLDARGQSWLFSSLLDNFRRAPLAEVALVLLTASLLRESGLPEVLARCGCCTKSAALSKAASGFSLSERRALQLFLSYVVLSATAVIALVATSSPLVVSSLGTFRGSPLHRAAFPLVLLWLMGAALVYGFSSGRLGGPGEALRVSGSLLARSAPCFATLFFVAQLLAAVCYVFPSFTCSPLLCALLYALPPLLHLVESIKQT